MLYQERHRRHVALSFRLTPFPKLFRVLTILLLLLLFVFISFLLLKDHSPHLFRQPKLKLGNGAHIAFVVDGKTHTNDLQYIYCQLSKLEKVFVHVITTGQGRGLSGKKLSIQSAQVPGCNVSVYDIETLTGDSDGDDIPTRIFLGIIQTFDQIQPDIMIYVQELESDAIRGIKAAMIASQRSGGVTEIAIPLEEVEHLMWLTDLPIKALKQWNTPKIQLQVITQDRPDSLARLIRSLKSSHYFGDSISLTINMDRRADPVTIEYCKTLEWNYGQKNIRHRIIQGGLMAAVVESYYPVDDNDYAVLLEDDVELSPFFYIWTKYSILKYRYGTDRALNRRMYGISLYSSRINELHLPGRKPFNPALSFEGTNYPLYSPYLCQIPCSWGATFFPEIWREFHHYFTARLEDWNNLRVQNITIPESRSNRWSNSWKRFFIELVYLRGYVMLYPNYENFTSLSTNHAEAGAHVHLHQGKSHINDIFDVPLMKENILLRGLPDGKLPEYSDLPTVDLLGNVVPEEELVQRGRSLHYEISQCPPSEYDDLTYDPQNLLCIDEEERQAAMDLQFQKEMRKSQLMTTVKSLMDNRNSSTDEQLLKLLNNALEIYRGDQPDTSRNDMGSV